MRLVLLRDLHLICIFIDAIKSELLTLTLQSNIVRIWAHIKLSPFYYKTNALSTIFYSYTAVYFVKQLFDQIYHVFINIPPKTQWFLKGVLIH